MANINRLKAWVRYDGKGRLVGGGPILQEHKPKNGDWVEIPYYEYCCQTTSTTTTQILALRLLFDDIANANVLVGDSSNVADWNTFFDLPTNGNPFTSVSVTGDEVKLYGGSSIIIKEELFYNVTSLLNVYDETGCIVSLKGYCFYGNENLVSVSFPNVTLIEYEAFEFCYSLTSVSLPLVEFIGSYCFTQCIALTSINLPVVITIDTSCFTQCDSLININLPFCTNLGPTVGDNDVFYLISGNTITLIVPAALMTCNSGNPDGDIQYLQSNNTVTVITV